MASTVFGIELAKRLGDAAIVVEADPGFVASDIWRNDPIMVRLVSTLPLGVPLSTLPQQDTHRTTSVCAAMNVRVDERQTPSQSTQAHSNSRAYSRAFISHFELRVPHVRHREGWV